MRVMLVDQILQVSYKYSVCLANALKAEGHDVVLVGDIAEVDCVEVPVLSLFNTSHKDKSKLAKVTNYFSAMKEVVNRAISEKFDILHVQWFQLSPVDYVQLARAKRAGVRVVVTVHDILPFNEHFYDKLYHRKIYGLADCIIVQAESNVERFKELFPEDASKLSLIPHGHFLDFANPMDQAEARKSLGLPSDVVVALYFGQIKEVKGVDILLEAFAGYLEEFGSDLYLVVAGSVWKADFEKSQAIVDDHKDLFEGNLTLDIRYIPEEDVAKYYSASDFAVLPYLDVYQSGVIQLAYAYGKPVVATDIKPFVEVVETDSEIGFLCKVGEPGSLKECMRKAVVCRNELPAMGMHGRESIRSRYSWSEIAESISGLYCSLSGMGEW